MLGGRKWCRSQSQGLGRYWRGHAGGELPHRSNASAKKVVNPAGLRPARLRRGPSRVFLMFQSRLVLLCQIGPVPPDMAYCGANTPRFRPRFSRLNLKHGGPHLSDNIVSRSHGRRPWI